jgi:hypothetical protein
VWDVVSKNLFTLASDGRFASQRTSNRRKYGVFVKILSWEKTFLMIWLDRKFFALPSKALRGFGNDFFEELGRGIHQTLSLLGLVDKYLFVYYLI